MIIVKQNEGAGGLFSKSKIPVHVLLTQTQDCSLFVHVLQF